MLLPLTGVGWSFILAPFVARRLIPLDRNPGVHQIDIGKEILWRPFLVVCIWGYVAAAEGRLQLPYVYLQGKSVGCEAAI